jgi:hypothetical protein
MQVVMCLTSGELAFHNIKFNKSCVSTITYTLQTKRVDVLNYQPSTVHSENSTQAALIEDKTKPPYSLNSFAFLLLSVLFLY